MYELSEFKKYIKKNKLKIKIIRIKNKNNALKAHIIYLNIYKIINLIYDFHYIDY